MIHVKNVKKSFKEIQALQGISFHVNRGEVFGLLGENGAGKTTALRIMATMLRPDQGQIFIDEKDTVQNSQEIRKHIGILFGGESGIYDRLTARENIAYFGQLNHMSKESIHQRMAYLVKALDMKDYIDRRAGKFSKGMKQKVAIARSIIHNPPVMLFDEPTSGLDVSGTRLIHQFIQSCKQEGKTVVFSSHSMAEVEKLCDRVGIIHKGKIVIEDSVDALKAQYQMSLEDIFLELVGERNGD